jgi:DNA-binding beta-propeller fold protein YncE
LPLKPVGSVPLPGGSSRLDYASVDPGRHRLYLAHLGGGLVIVFDTRKRRVVKTIPAPGAHGVLSVPGIGRVYATATNDRQLLTIDERTNRVLDAPRPATTLSRSSHATATRSSSRST